MITEEAIARIENEVFQLATQREEDELKNQMNGGYTPNWFPCGRAYLAVSGNSEIVRFLKKRNHGYIEATKWTTGYAIFFRRSGHSAYASQALHYHEYVIDQLRDKLRAIGVECFTSTWID